MTTIDIPLLKLQYEILNIPLEQLASEIAVPKSLLETEARNNNWTQWWPDSDETLNSSTFVQGSAELSSYIAPLDEDPLYDEDLSPLEEGAQAYIKQARVRLQVFNLAKEIYLTHKYASFEATLLDKAKGIIESSATAQELQALSNIMKNLTAPAFKNAASLAFGHNEDGIPSVIIRDLTGRK